MGAAVLGSRSLIETHWMEAMLVNATSQADFCAPGHTAQYPCEQRYNQIHNFNERKGASNPNKGPGRHISHLPLACQQTHITSKTQAITQVRQRFRVFQQLEQTDLIFQGSDQLASHLQSP